MLDYVQIWNQHNLTLLHLLEERNDDFKVKQKTHHFLYNVSCWKSF